MFIEYAASPTVSMAHDFIVASYVATLTVQREVWSRDRDRIFVLYLEPPSCWSAPKHQKDFQYTFHSL
jgi:hypothetical protein